MDCGGDPGRSLSGERRYIIEGRLVDLRLHVMASQNPIYGRHEFVFSLEVSGAWHRSAHAEVVVDWAAALRVPPHAPRTTEFRADPRLANPGLKPGDHVRLVVRVEADERYVEELAVKVGRRFTHPHASLGSLTPHHPIARRFTDDLS
jgi:hypothetical protein